MNSQWISFKDRKPSAGDYPIIVCGSSERGRLLPMRVITGLDEYDPCRTHWMPSQLLEPPKKELTQTEKDQSEYEHYIGSCDPCNAEGHIWHAALAYERKEIAGIIRQIGKGHGWVIQELGRRTETT